MARKKRRKPLKRTNLASPTVEVDRESSDALHAGTSGLPEPRSSGRNGRCGVPTCPCQDGDPCNYEDHGDTKAMVHPEIERLIKQGVPRSVAERVALRIGHGS